MYKLLLPAALLLLTACPKPMVEEPIGPAPKEAISVDGIVPLSTRDLVPVGDVSGATQAYLAKRMRDHGRNATDLLYAVVLLDHEGTKRIAKRIVTGPSRDPYYKEDEARLHEEFPAAFFDLESTMRANARLLGVAANRGRGEEVVHHYTRIVGLCVDCHTLFTERRSDKTAPEERTKTRFSSADLLQLKTQTVVVEAGKKLFERNCIACHGPEDEDNVARDLRDKVWLAKTVPEKIAETIWTGTPNGMPAWGPSLGDEAVKQLSVYLLSLVD